MSDRSVFPTLSPGALHVWRVRLDLPSDEVQRLSDRLSNDERCRAKRFVRNEGCRHYTVAHAALRTIVGGYLNLEPSHVSLTVRPGGKPELSPGVGAIPLRFNLSHSGELAMLAVAWDREVGVDVERVRPTVEAENIIRRFFAPGEQSAWLATSDSQRLAAFFRAWTRKEAYLKARGAGLAGGLDRFEVSLEPDRPARVLRGEEPWAQWPLYDVSPGDGYTAACMIEPPSDAPTVYDWPIR
ncbi:MAG: 4'-phosphopantetheinyl transferase superfamily protein [Planctomycetaceae bacterium]|nr:4'-phosphopantetheinyl transferase superfamily protein [Planctomycetaceae bacterium]